MKTKTLFITLLIIISISFGLKAQKMANLWYLPSMSLYQAENLSNYDLLVIDPENLFTSQDKLDEILSINPKIKLLLYINAVEIFEPMFDDKPWGLKLLNELQTKKQWWLRQPDGKKLGAWPEMKTLDMRFDCPEIEGQKYWQWIAQKYLKLLQDSRIKGCLIDNVWGDDRAGIEWLATFNGQKGLDLNDNKEADTNFKEINASWTKGTRSFLNLIRQEKGNDFIIITNPGNLSYREVNGKQFENFPYLHHHMKGGSDWDINMMIAKKYKIAIINPDEKDFLLGAVTSVMLNNAYLCVGQNQLYHDYYNLELGKILGKTKEISKGLWSRPFGNGTVFIDTKAKKAWVEYKNATKREK
jgi:hypothetical protein